MSLRRPGENSPSLARAQRRTASRRAAALLLHHARGQRRVAELERRCDTATFHFDQIEKIGVDRLSGNGGAHLGPPLPRRLRPVDEHGHDLMVENLEGLYHARRQGAVLLGPSTRVAMGLALEPAI